MAGLELRLNSPGIAAWMRANLAGPVAAAASQVAGMIDEETSVQTGVNRDGRPFALVTVTHPGGLAKQAKHGILTRAAAQAGIDVKRYPTP